MLFSGRQILSSFFAHFSKKCNSNKFLIIFSLNFFKFSTIIIINRCGLLMFKMLSSMLITSWLSSHTFNLLYCAYGVVLYVL